MKHILVIDNQISTCELLSKFLKKNDYEVATTTRGKTALEMVQQRPFDLILADFHLPDIPASKLFDEIRKSDPVARIILMGKEVNLKNAVDMLRKGVRNFISKPLNPDELLEAIQEAEKNTSTAQTREEEAESMPTVNAAPTPELVSGKSKKARAILDHVKRVGPTNFSVIIQGETGTGKESLARLIHQASPRRDGPFVAVDCGCLSRELASSELFGHEKGAFTGAVFQKTGFFEQANGGTIFLDEIANLPMDVQIALLRVLQEKVIRKVGGIKEIAIDVRLISATNENLLAKSESSGFREDLYFRLCEYLLEIPSLRERPEDIPLFIDFFLVQTSKELGKPQSTLSDEVLGYLQEYNWPGNIRELRNVIRRSSLFAGPDHVIQKSSLPTRITDFKDHGAANLANSGEPVLTEKRGDLKFTALKAESRRIMEVLEKVRYNKTKAAELLNIHRKTLYVKLKLLNIPC
ncbi:sigma-54-dependent transcriptional regulator [Algoriphagus terrigena]|uniref:sigma-54-dependent transcriptional regulator n=1 Tax=Algoriphagus terrigena TaxID=344884 RepID=UPI00040DDD25|nr:sigma-54 dependent transcriptional regulator [Algoriphagus terrigena]